MYLAPVTHVALWKFRGDKIASVILSVGRVGYTSRLEKIETPISRIVQALHTHSYREQAPEAHVARVASQATARTTPPTEPLLPTAASHTLAGPPPGTAGEGTGSAAGGRRLLVFINGVADHRLQHLLVRPRAWGDGRPSVCADGGFGVGREVEGTRR